MPLQPTELLEDRLERLAKLHTDGELNDAEYTSAKAMVLAPATTSATAAVDGVAPTVRTLGPLGPGIWLLIAIIVGFTLACLGSAFTTLQRPAAPILCRNGDYVAGIVSEHYGSTTTYNIDSSCVSAAGEIRELSQVAIIGVLWVEYTIAALAVIAVLVWIIRGLRGPPRRDEPELLLS